MTFDGAGSHASGFTEGHDWPRALLAARSHLHHGVILSGLISVILSLAHTAIRGKLATNPLIEHHASCIRDWELSSRLVLIMKAVSSPAKPQRY